MESSTIASVASALLAVAGMIVPGGMRHQQDIVLSVETYCEKCAMGRHTAIGRLLLAFEAKGLIDALACCDLPVPLRQRLRTRLLEATAIAAADI